MKMSPIRPKGKDGSVFIDTSARFHYSEEKISITAVNIQKLTSLSSKFSRLSYKIIRFNSSKKKKGFCNQNKCIGYKDCTTFFQLCVSFMDNPLEILVRCEVMNAPSRQYCAPEKKQTAAVLRSSGVCVDFVTKEPTRPAVSSVCYRSHVLPLTEAC